MEKKIQQEKKEDIMGADCGCGGECSQCASRLASEMNYHIYEINKTAEQAGIKSTKTKKKQKRKSK